ncbi:lipase family protein [Nocardia sp. GTS18]|uniref:lipase family protein n=1 Tax=Nocardia sp. GTS18 TaxID=1778064 RepID=UPI0015EF8316|nr:lipase family protein [Nocardia sp. GTS18]
MGISVRALAFAAVIGVCAASGTHSAAGLPPVYPIPDPDPFYAAPADIAAADPGAVLAVRVQEPLPYFPTATVTLVKFRSADSHGRPIAATTTILTPRDHRPGAPLLSYQHIINGLGTQCAVSRALYAYDPNLLYRAVPLLNTMLLRGWSIALPDHLGPNAAYGAARLGGQLTLDGIRAATRVPELGLADSPAALLGYSGGGMATGWAAALAPRYAPELRLVGAAQGGVPMNITTMARTLGLAPHPMFGLAMAAALGLEREYPDRLPISAQLNDTGLAVRDAMANGCTVELIAAGAMHSAADLASTVSLIDDPRVWEVSDANSLELFDGVPTMPVFEWHTPIDPLIPVDAIDRTTRRYCAAGTPVRSELYPSPDHLATAVLGFPSAVDWLDARFRGEPAPSNC